SARKFITPTRRNLSNLQLSQTDFSGGEAREPLPRVTLVVVAAQLPALLSRSLYSIVEQTYPAHLLEVQIVLSGHQFDDLKLARDFREQNAAIRCEIIQGDITCRKAAAKGILKVNGDYVSFVDAGDLLQPNYVASLVATARPNTVVLAEVLKRAPDPESSLTVSNGNVNGFEPVPAVDALQLLEPITSKLIPRQLMSQMLDNPTVSLKDLSSQREFFVVPAHNMGNAGYVISKDQNQA